MGIGLAAGLALAAPGDAAWEAEIVDMPHDFEAHSMALDAAGQPAFAYGKNGLFYAQLDGSSLVIEVADPDACYQLSRPSLAFAPDGEPAVAYHDEAAGALRLARRSSGSWASEVVDALAGGRRESALAYDPSGAEVIAYGSAMWGLRLARWTGSAWSIEVVDAAAGSDLDMVLDAAGNPLISYGGVDGELRLARWTGSSWVYEVIDATVTVDKGTSIALDAVGNPAVSYHDVAPCALRYAAFDGAAWSLEIVQDVDVVGWSSSLAFDLSGDPAISFTYYDPDPWNALSAVRLARRSGSTWSIETLEEGGAYSDRWSQLAFDPSGEPVVSWYGLDEPSGWPTNRVRYWAGSFWIVASVDRDRSFGFESVSLAIDPSGHPAIAHNWSSVGRLSRWDGASWQVDAQFDVGPFAFAPDGEIWMSLASSRGDLHYAVRQHTGFLIRPAYLAQPSAEVRDPTAPVFDVNGDALIAFQEHTPSESRVMIARYDGTGWTSEVVAEGYELGESPSLAITRAGALVVAYHDAGGAALQVASRRGSFWQVETVDAGDVGSHVAIAIDPRTDRPVVSYVDYGNGQLKVATNHGAGWTIETVDDLDGDSNTSIAFDSRGLLAVGYKSGSWTRFAVRDLGHWYTEQVAEVGGTASFELALAFDGRDRLQFAYPTHCRDDRLELARWDRPLPRRWSRVLSTVASPTSTPVSSGSPDPNRAAPTVGQMP